MIANLGYHLKQQLTGVGLIIVPVDSKVALY